MIEVTNIVKRYGITPCSIKPRFKFRTARVDPKLNVSTGTRGNLGLTFPLTRVAEYLERRWRPVTRA